MAKDRQKIIFCIYLSLCEPDLRRTTHSASHERLYAVVLHPAEGSAVFPLGEGLAFSYSCLWPASYTSPRHVERRHAILNDPERREKMSSLVRIHDKENGRERLCPWGGSALSVATRGEASQRRVCWRFRGSWLNGTRARPFMLGMLAIYYCPLAYGVT